MASATQQGWHAVVSAEGVTLTPREPGAVVTLTLSDLESLYTAVSLQRLAEVEPWGDAVQDAQQQVAQLHAYEVGGES